MIVVDKDFHVEMWSQKTEELWGVRADEALGRHLLNLDFGLPVDALRPLIRGCFGGEVKSQQKVVDATDRRGRAFRCHAACMPLSGRGGEVRSVLLLLDEHDGRVAINESNKEI